MASGVYAETKPFQASLTPDIAIHSKETRINGFSLNIWGENPQSGFALGFVNGSSGDSVGFCWGLANYTQNYTGVHWSWVNIAKGHFTGWQYGLFNYADTFTGLQLAWVNYARTGQSGVQIGLVNIIQENEWFKNFPKELAKGMIFVNWRF
jgi:hypothetical protein